MPTVTISFYLNDIEAKKYFKNKEKINAQTRVFIKDLVGCKK